MNKNKRSEMYSYTEDDIKNISNLLSEIEGLTGNKFIYDNIKEIKKILLK